MSEYKIKSEIAESAKKEANLYLIVFILCMILFIILLFVLFIFINKDKNDLESNNSFDANNYPHCEYDYDEISGYCYKIINQYPAHIDYYCNNSNERLNGTLCEYWEIGNKKSKKTCDYNYTYDSKKNICVRELRKYASFYYKCDEDEKLVNNKCIKTIVLYDMWRVRCPIGYYQNEFGFCETKKDRYADSVYICEIGYALWDNICIKIDEKLPSTTYECDYGYLYDGNNCYRYKTTSSSVRYYCDHDDVLEGTTCFKYDIKPLIK